MPDDSAPKGTRMHGFGTRMSHAGRAGTRVHGFVNPPVVRGSTVLYANCADRVASASKRFDQALTYGTQGGPNHHALEDVICEIEGGTRCQIVSTGLAAVTVPLLAFLKAGEHMLMPDSVYGPARAFADGMLARLGIETTFYDPCIDEAGIAALMRPNTTVVYTESPGSHSFEMQDIPAIARAAHAKGAKVLMDNTWGIRHFQPFRHGVDVSIQALTKYVVGHSDVLLGSITVNSDEHWKALRWAALQLGQYASPDDCWLALRGVRTMPVRLEKQAASALEVAAWLAKRPEVLKVLHPALPGAPGHEIWKRDFTGACSLFGVVFRPEFSVEASHAFVDSLTLFGIGASWGGYESLALPTTGFITRSATNGDLGGPTVRLHIGLEDTADLIADIEAGLAVLRGFKG
ncbi:cystathionine beta-lyase [Elioraea rosea]|uniref:cystathionine beta-lyase n=1 Tax=Elioraea rosea TaxID=2492390 RepID=UPI0011843078|nr:cystathionine beta-lyase [Elioraea rosea]